MPRDPGNLSAFGLLTVDVRNDDVQTAVQRHRDLDPAAVERAYAELQARSAAALRQEGFAEPEHRFARSADLRYFGQAFEVRVPVADGPLDAEAVAGRLPRRPRGRCTATASAATSGSRSSGSTCGSPASARSPGRSCRGCRCATATSSGRARAPAPSCSTTPCETPVYWRPDLSPGDVLHGPAVVEEFGSTIPLHPGFRAEVDGFGNVRVTRDRETASGAAR